MNVNVTWMHYTVWCGPISKTTNPQYRIKPYEMHHTDLQLEHLDLIMAQVADRHAEPRLEKVVGEGAQSEVGRGEVERKKGR